MYMLPPDYTKSDNDIYGKGALVLNSLRVFDRRRGVFQSAAANGLSRPENGKSYERQTNAFATTDDFLRIAEKESGKELDWFFEFTAPAALPKLIAETKGESIRFALGNAEQYAVSDAGRSENRRRNKARRNDETTCGDDFFAAYNKANAQYTIDPNGWLDGEAEKMRRGNLTKIPDSFFEFFERIINGFRSQTNGVAAQIAPFVKTGQQHQTPPHRFVYFRVGVIEKTKKLALQIALPLNHQNSDGEKIIFAETFERIGEIEQAGDFPFPFDFCIRKFPK
jgi:hypothetical protein